MLKLRPSLKLRAAGAFIVSYVAIFVGMLVLMTVGPDVAAKNRLGPNIALSFAADELRRTHGVVQISEDGRFRRLSSKNPSLWLIGQADGQRFSFGSVPPQAHALFDQYAGVLYAGTFQLPGVVPPLSESAMGRRATAVGSVLVAVGGIDPQTLTFADSFSYFILGQGLLPLFLIASVGLVAMLCALPLLTSAFKRVTADAAAILPERPDRRIAEAGVPNELVPLVRGLNSALDRLAHELTRRKRFIADVAHELRTPLSILSLQVDSLKEQIGKHDLQRVVARISQLVGQMLDVERLSLQGQQRSEVDLVALARNVVADIAPLALASGYEISLDAPAGPVTVIGDPHSLSRAIANLVGNSVAHGNGKGRIQVVVSEQWTLDVLDDGPGVPVSIRDSVFEPFCREPWDRDGCGLGLHLTREIMRAHGGDAILLQTEGGAAFRLEFPR
jgi:two-component system, OmpR family, sensor kinase